MGKDLQVIKLKANPSLKRKGAKRRAPREVKQTGYVIMFFRKNKGRLITRYWSGSRLVAAKRRAKRYVSFQEAKKAARSVFRTAARSYDSSLVVRP